MYYEVKFKFYDDAEGTVKTKKVSALVCDENFTSAIASGIKHFEGMVEDCESIRHTRIAEVINPDMANKGLNPYTATLKADSIDNDGKPKKVSWMVVCFASNFEEATNMMTEYLQQGYEDFQIHGLKQEKWTEFVNII